MTKEHSKTCDPAVGSTRLVGQFGSFIGADGVWRECRVMRREGAILQVNYMIPNGHNVRDAWIERTAFVPNGKVSSGDEPR